MKTQALISAILLTVLARTAPAATYDVYPDGSGDAPTIQAAIDLAVSGDGIQVYSGTYYEDDLLADGKDLVLINQGGLALVVSSVPGSGTGLTIRNVSEAFTMTGFEFRGYGKGVVIDSGSPTFWFSRLIECGTGIEISGTGSAPQVMFCLVDSCGTGAAVNGAEGALVRNMTVVNCQTGIEVSAGSVTLSRNIVYGCDTGFYCTGGSASLGCNDLWLNTADYTGCGPGTQDISALPRFCFEAGGAPGPYYLHEDSPCWAENNGCGYDMGAFTQLPGCTGTAVEQTTWGAIKRLHR